MPTIDALTVGGVLLAALALALMFLFTCCRRH
jgi:hypothetical protein